MVSMADPQGRAERRERARLFVFDWLSEDGALRRYESLYEDAVETGKASNR
jgi:hypothetical protein